ncbi:MAG: DUF547 domain-containing protein [Acidobacteria bacterium]|nr:DUF547 domain-containing protein [Acidobacteriota bacterium]
MLRPLAMGIVLLAGCLTGAAASLERTAADFDHTYADYGAILATHVSGSRVDYARLAASHTAFDEVVAAFGAVAAHDEAGWSRAERMAYWINAYNVFTLRAIIDHYPIRGSWFSRYPKNSIRQISGVWTNLRWNAGGRQLTLDDIEHKLLRPQFQDPRVHFAINCASVSCPPLASEPYRSDRLEAQLDRAAVRYLSGPTGLVVDGTTLRLSSIFDWYGGDFDLRYSPRGPAGQNGTTRALLGMVATHGPEPAQALALQPGTRIAFLDYDWTLNDTTMRR